MCVGLVSWAHFHYFPPSEFYPLGLGLGPRQVPVRVRIAEEWVMQASGLVSISKNTKCTDSETEGRAGWNMSRRLSLSTVITISIHNE